MGGCKRVADADSSGYKRAKRQSRFRITFSRALVLAFEILIVCLLFFSLFACLFICVLFYVLFVCLLFFILSFLSLSSPQVEFCRTLKETNTGSVVENVAHIQAISREKRALFTAGVSLALQVRLPAVENLRQSKRVHRLLYGDSSLTLNTQQMSFLDALQLVLQTLQNPISELFCTKAKSQR